MPRILSILIVLVLSLVARGQDQKSADAFLNAVDIAPLRPLSLQHNQTIKTYDTYARDALVHITGRSKFDDRPAALEVADMMLAPQRWVGRNVIYIRNKPFRTDFERLDHIDAREKQRILEEGTISLSFWVDPRTQQAMERIRATATEKGKAVNEISQQAATLAMILDYPTFGRNLHSLALVAPIDAPDANSTQWMGILDVPEMIAHAREGAAPERLGAYADAVQKVAESIYALSTAWQAEDAARVNQAIADLAASAPQVNPAVYPSELKRNAEVRYNSLARLTWPGAALYAIAVLLFLLGWVTNVKWLRYAAWATVLGGFLVHTAGIAVRWWLVEKSVGEWFHAIPIKNQFESVMFAAWFGVLVALLLESGLISRTLKLVSGYEFKTLAGQGLFGAAASCVGVMALVALFVVPYITKSDIIRGSISQNAGILMTYWLYIHVTLVTASYALIGMTFVLGGVYLVTYLANPVANSLKTIDAANLTMLQLAFWVLGIGIITGALWADVSWGRPWGWDPKETFALITWIVYLIIVHIRFVTHGQKRALITSALSVIGFFVMLFNWIGVNYFLVGLHSYA